MSKFPTDCLTTASIQPNSTILARIEACQAAANTTYCFPPNGTRICTPALDIPFFWSPKSYHSDAKVALSWDPSSTLVLLQNNTGNDTQDYTPYMYDYRATYLPSQPYERALKMSILERRFNSVDDPYNLATYEGPTLILVKTAEWPSRTSAYAAPTATHGGSGDHAHDFDSEGDDRKFKGIIAGIVLGVVAVIVLAVFCCCRQCCCTKRRVRRLKVDREAQAGVLAQGEDVMAQSGGVGKIVHLHRVADVESPVDGGERIGHDDEIRRVEADRRSQEGDDMSAHGDPPPKYTP